MPVFQWQGVSLSGETVSGEMEAPSRAAVLVRLKSQRVQPIARKVREKGKGLGREITFSIFSDRGKDGDLVIFTRQLAAMMNAGLAIVASLDILAEQSANKLLRNAVRGVKDDIEAGST